MRLAKLDLRLRIAVALATVCIAVVGALGTALYLASEDMAEALVEQLVQKEMQSLIRRAGATRRDVAAGSPHVDYYVVRSPADAERLPGWLRSLGPGYHQAGRGPDELQVQVRDVAGVRYIVAYDAGPYEVLEARFTELLLLAFAIVVALAVFLAYWLAGVLTLPLRQLAARVGELSHHLPQPRLEREDHDRDVAFLARTLDAYHRRIVDMIRREQEFTSNASHELRTPLTAIRTSCELLLTEPASEKAPARIEMIDVAAKQMTERIDALLALARRSDAAHVQAISLRSCVDEVVAAYRGEIDRKGLIFCNEIHENEQPRLDRKALQLVLANLIENAVRYTSAGEIRVSYAAPCLTVADTGTGIPERDHARVFDRYYRGDYREPGTGLGLAIVRRVCEDLGWRIEVKTTCGTGSTFVVLLA